VVEGSYECHREAEACAILAKASASRGRAFNLVFACAPRSPAGPGDVKAMFGTAVDVLPDNRLVFDINVNKYRLVVRVSYEFQAVLIKFVGTHAEYDRIDARTI
jgi:mRNA-degrading endonuclease HigB of HigAB toxin-antitoxin module